LVTELAAVDTDLGVLKTGKEANVHLLERGVPGSDRRCLLASKRYRGADHRLFHRDASYLEGRRLRRVRDQRAMDHRTNFGRNLIAQQWSTAEFAALCQLWSAGVPVPYPVQCLGTEVLMEFIGDEHGTPAPRLAQLRPERGQLLRWWEMLRAAMVALGRLGYTHGDLSAYNILVDGDDLVLIDLPQLVDLVVNPQGRRFLERDARRICEWFTARGLSEDVADPEGLVDLVLSEAGLA
jgi:RIO kinase 1